MHVSECVCGCGHKMVGSTVLTLGIGLLLLLWHSPDVSSGGHMVCATVLTKAFQKVRRDCVRQKFFYWCYTKLLLSQCTFCKHHAAMHQTHAQQRGP